VADRGIGAKAEDAAVDFLKSKGYKILSRNFATKLGEVDIVARDADTYCFIEVKARSSDRFGLPQEAVSRSKQRQISKAALSYLKAKGLFDHKARFDVVSVIYSDDSPSFDLIKNAFELDETFTY
jgi:putative endonuclease